MIIAAAACFCAVVITSGTGNKPQAIATLQQLNAMNGAMLVKQVLALSRACCCTQQSFGGGERAPLAYEC